MKFTFLTIFPHIFDSYLDESILKRAHEKKLVEFKAVDLRDFSENKHRRVDDTPYGGGPGMVMQVGPIAKAVKSLPRGKKTKVVLLSAKGKTFTQAMARSYAKLDELVLISGRYEGVDERILKYIDEEVSIGDYVLTGGELGALVIADAVTRLLPGVLGDDESSQDESHTQKGVLEYPHYTRPETWDSHTVPQVLLSGDHKRILEWREKHKKRKK